MNIARNIVLAAGVSFCHVAGAQTTVAVGDINVIFPFQPEKIERDDMTQYQMHDRNMGYMMKVSMSSSNAPAGEILQKEIEQKRTDGADKKVEKIIDIQIGHYEGKEVHFSADLGGHKVPVTSRVYVIGSTIYWLELIDIYNAGLYATVGRDFFDSITLR